MKKTLYFDMDGVLADFIGSREQWLRENPDKKAEDYEDAENIFEVMEPIDGAIEAVYTLAEKYDVYVCSTVPWNNLSGASGKIRWIQNTFGGGKENPFYKRVVLTHHKHLNIGDYLIDDRPKNGAERFDGEWIQFGSERFPDWNAVTAYLIDK